MGLSGSGARRMKNHTCSGPGTTSQGLSIQPNHEPVARTPLGSWPDGGTERATAKATPSREFLHTGLPRLEALLSALPRNRRRQAIERLSAKLREVLLRHMEEGRQQTVIPSSVRKQPGNGAQRGSGHANERVLRRGQVCTVRCSSRMLHFARVTIDGISVCSRCTGRAEAQRLQEFLNQAAVAASSSDELRDVFSEAHCGTPPPRWSFRVLVDARAWVGRVLSTHRVGTIEEALELRQQLREARNQGWCALRRVWAKYMPKVCRSGCFSRAKRIESAVPWVVASLQDRLEACDALWCVVQARRGTVSKQRKDRQEARLERRARLAEDRLLRTARRLERLLSSRTSVSRARQLPQRPSSRVAGRKRQIGREEQRLRKARLLWHRDPCRTMSEILHGPPASIREGAHVKVDGGALIASLSARSLPLASSPSGFLSFVTSKEAEMGA